MAGLFYGLMHRLFYLLSNSLYYTLKNSQFFLGFLNYYTTERVILKCILKESLSKFLGSSFEGVIKYIFDGSFKMHFLRE